MKMLLSVGAVGLMLAGFGDGIDATATLPLDQAIGLAEKGDARGMYSLSVNLACAGSVARELENVRWLRCSAGKLLFMAEEAGSADAIFLLGALAERMLYADIGRTSQSGGLSRLSSPRFREKSRPVEGVPENCAVSALPVIDTDIPSLSDSAKVFWDIEWPWIAASQNAAGALIGGTRRPGAEINLKQVYHPDSKTVRKYNLCALTNEVVKAYVRAHYLKARELGAPTAEAALSRFEANCLRMAAILEAKSPKEKNAQDVRELLNSPSGSETAQREAERAEQRAQLKAIQEQLKLKRAQEAQAASADVGK